MKTNSKSFNNLRVLIPVIIGILVMATLYQILPSEIGKVTKVVETTTAFEQDEDESIENLKTELETTTTTLATTTTEETSTTSTTIIPGDPLCEDLGCPYGTNFVGSKSSDLYHYCHCSHAKRIKPENLICFYSEEEAIQKGYTQSSCQQTTTTYTTTSTTTTSETTTTSVTVSTTTTTSSSSTTLPLSGTYIGEIHYLDPEWVERL